MLWELPLLLSYIIFSLVQSPASLGLSLLCSRFLCSSSLLLSCVKLSLSSVCYQTCPHMYVYDHISRSEYILNCPWESKWTRIDLSIYAARWMNKTGGIQYRLRGTSREAMRSRLLKSGRSACRVSTVRARLTYTPCKKGWYVASCPTAS